MIQPIITAEEGTRFERELQKMQDDFDRRTKYKVDVHLKQKSFGQHAPSRRYFGHIMLFEQGGSFDIDGFQGFGDASMMWCTNCDMPVKSDFIHLDIGICPFCANTGTTDDAFQDAVVFSFADLSKLAKLIYSIYIKLECDADLVVRRYFGDMHKAHRDLMVNTRNQDELRRARMAKEPAVYTRDRFHKDMEGGADPSMLIRHWLEA